MHRVQLRTGCLALARNDDNLVETVGRRQPDANVLEAGEQPFLAGIIEARFGDDVDKQAVSTQRREVVLQELVFQPYPLAASFLVAKVPAIGRVEEKHIDRLRRNVRFQRIGAQQLVQVGCGLCRAVLIQFNAVALPEGIALVAGKMRQRTATATTGVEAFHRLGRRFNQQSDATQGGIVSRVVAHRRIIVGNARVHQISHKRPPVAADRSSARACRTDSQGRLVSGGSG